MSAPALKRIAVPIWNAGVHAARALAEVASAVASGRIMRCACCGRHAPMILRPRSIPPRLVELWGLSPREARALIRKETLHCLACGAKLRSRRLAEVVLETFSVSGPQPASLRDWATRPEAQSLRVAEINRIEGVHEAISGLPLLRSSDFADEPSATPSEDLAALSYADASFDLVLTSETLEHVPDLALALSEIRRVLRPGGWHLFTIPVRPGVSATFARARINPDGCLVQLAPPISHPGGDWGYPVFTEFGVDVVDVIDRAGFATSVRFGPTTEDDFSQVYASRRR